MGKIKRYSFKDIDKCEMCGESSETHKTLGIRLNKSQGKNPKNKIGIAVGVKKCRKCNLIYASPQPIPNDLQDHYGTPPEDYWKPEYFDWNKKYFHTQTKTAQKLLDFKKGMTALDIGAGLGKAMLTLENEGFDAFGLEPSKPFYKRAIEQMGISEKKLTLGAVEELEYDPESFDFITFGAVVEHLYNPKECIEKAIKWLKPNGIIHIEVPSSNWFISVIINTYYKLIGTNYVTNLSPMHTPFHLYEFDLTSFERLGEEIGFNVEKHHFTVCEIFFVPKFLHPLLRWYMKKTNKGMQLTVYLKKK